MGGRKTIPAKNQKLYVTIYEQAVVDYLLEQAFDVEFITPLRIQYRKTPDIVMDGVPWEIKTPKGNASRTIENIIRSGKHQASHIILDLRFTKRPDVKCLAEARARFTHLRVIEELLIICKNTTHVHLRRNS